MLQDRSIAQWIQMGTGAVLLGAGLYLGFLSFREAEQTLHTPTRLSVWLELRTAVSKPAADAEKKDTPMFSFKPEASLVKDEQIHVLGGYFTLLLGILLLLAMAKIAAAFISAGAGLIRQGADGRPRRPHA